MMGVMLWIQGDQGLNFSTNYSISEHMLVSLPLSLAGLTCIEGITQVPLPSGLLLGLANRKQWWETSV